MFEIGCISLHVTRYRARYIKNHVKFQFGTLMMRPAFCCSSHDSHGLMDHGIHATPLMTHFDTTLSHIVTIICPVNLVICP